MVVGGHPLGFVTMAEEVGQIRQVVDRAYRAESRRILATLIRLLGDFDRAEEALHDAFRAALEQWPKDGVPDNARAWLVSTGRFEAIDGMRRQARFDASLADLAERIETETAGSPIRDDERVGDDRLRLIFMCCHPALVPEARIALTLREVCGLTTEEIAGAFLTSSSTLAQRIVRAKAKIRDARNAGSLSISGVAERLEGGGGRVKYVLLIYADEEAWTDSERGTATKNRRSGDRARCRFPARSNDYLVKRQFRNPEEIGQCDSCS